MACLHFVSISGLCELWHIFNIPFEADVAEDCANETVSHGYAR